MKKIVFLFLMQFILVGSSEAAVKTAGILTGKLTADSECAKGQNQIWVSKGRTLLYQADLPANGTYEFHLNPGKYNVVVTGSEGCFVETVAELTKGKEKEINLNLSSGKTERTPAGRSVR